MATTQGKLRPFNDAKISFPGFQRILNFTSSGGEGTQTLTVSGDTDKEYIVLIRNLTSYEINLRFNSDSGSSYSDQYLYTNGTVSAGRLTSTAWVLSKSGPTAVIEGLSEFRIQTPTGLLKTGYHQGSVLSSGTTVSEFMLKGYVYNSTSNITSMAFYPTTGTFVSGTRIIVFARRS